MSQLRHFVLLILCGSVLLLISTFATGVTADADPGPLTPTYFVHLPVVNTPQTITNCRYGATIRQKNIDGYWLPTLGTGHYINFTTNRDDILPEETPFMFQIRVRQDREDGVYLPRVFFSPPLTMDEDGLGPLVLANRGEVWLVGNEPDVANPVQDNIMPSTYAHAYHDVYHFIKDLDPTAQVAIGGLSMFTPGRRQYMDIVWNTYWKAFGTAMPVDIWNIHLYILSEIRPWDGGHSDGKVALGTDPALAYKAPSGEPPHIECPKDDVICRAEHDDIQMFKEQIIDLRQWMKEHKQQDKPLILTEFSLLYPFLDYDDPINPSQCFLRDEFGGCFTQQRVSNFMRQTLDFLENGKDPDLGYPEDDYRLVQQWTWYSMWTEGERSGSSSNFLRDGYQVYDPGSPGALTQVGQMYRRRIMESDRRVNLVAAEPAEIVVRGIQPGETVNVNISLDFYNNGATPISTPVVAAFFRDAALQDVIGGKAVNPQVEGIIQGCSWEHPTHRATVTWKNLPLGTHQFWAKIDPDNKVPGEVSETDNVVRGTVTILP